MKKYFSIIVIVLLLTSTAFAKQITQKADVLFNAVNVKLNGKDVQVDSMSHDGTTYLSLRAVAEMFNTKVDWENETKTVEINDKGTSDSNTNINKENPLVTIEMENGDKIKMEFYPEVAPNTVNNFISLINKGYYNGLDFHRVIPGFMIQGGDPAGNGSGGPGYAIKGEFAKNGVENKMLHTRGVVSMARAAVPDSAGSQFFIVVEDSHFLNGEYAAFGKVIEGMDFVDNIVNVDRDASDKPSTAQVMKSISVDLFDETYEEPEVIK